MNTEQLKTHCRSLPNALEQASGDPSNVLTYSIGGKNFAYFKTSAPERWRFSFRVMPERFLELTDQPGIKPARYMGRFHWVTVVDVETMDDAYLQELVMWSYDKAFGSLPKRQQDALRTDDG